MVRRTSHRREALEPRLVTGVDEAGHEMKWIGSSCGGLCELYRGRSCPPRPFETTAASKDAHATLGMSVVGRDERPRSSADAIERLEA